MLFCEFVQRMSFLQIDMLLSATGETQMLLSPIAKSALDGNLVT